jgi:hypothetical protein
MSATMHTLFVGGRLDRQMAVWPIRTDAGIPRGLDVALDDKIFRYSFDASGHLPGSDEETFIYVFVEERDSMPDGVVPIPDLGSDFLAVVLP